MSEEWGPWIEHDGKGCPCVGQWVAAEFEVTGIREGRAGEDFDGKEAVVGSSWHWDIGFWERIIRYRIRKPRGLTILEEVANGVREPVDA